MLYGCILRSMHNHNVASNHHTLQDIAYYILCSIVWILEYATWSSHLLYFIQFQVPSVVARFAIRWAIRHGTAASVLNRLLRATPALSWALCDASIHETPGFVPHSSSPICLGFSFLFRVDCHVWACVSPFPTVVAQSPPRLDGALLVTDGPFD